MELTKLEIGQLWKAKDDQFLILQTAKGLVTFQFQASGIIHTMPTEEFRIKTQCLLKQQSNKIPQNRQEIAVGDVWESEGNLYVAVRHLRKKLQLTNGTEQLSFGDLFEPKLVSVMVPYEFVGTQIVAFGEIWKVLGFNNHSVLASKGDDTKSLDWRAIGSLDMETFIGSECDIEEVVLMGTPLPNYGHLKFWRQFCLDMEVGA